MEIIHERIALHEKRWCTDTVNSKSMWQYYNPHNLCHKIKKKNVVNFFRLWKSSWLRTDDDGRHTHLKKPLRFVSRLFLMQSNNLSFISLNPIMYGCRNCLIFSPEYFDTRFDALLLTVHQFSLVFESSFFSHHSMIAVRCQTVWDGYVINICHAWSHDVVYHLFSDFIIADPCPFTIPLSLRKCVRGI